MRCGAAVSIFCPAPGEEKNQKHFMADGEREKLLNGYLLCNPKVSQDVPNNLSYGSFFVIVG